MRIISQELRAWEQEEYGDLRDLEVEGICCWFCGEQIGGTDYAETTMDVDGMAMWVPVCDHCDPPPPPPEPEPADALAPAIWAMEIGLEGLFASPQAPMTLATAKRPRMERVRLNMGGTPSRRDDSSLALRRPLAESAEKLDA